jgi:hypothetical protein
MSVYFIQAEDGGPIKIGVATDVDKRLAGLQTSHHRTLVVRRVLEGSVELERELHERFASARLVGEWFRPIKRVAKFGHCIPGAPAPKKPRVVYRPMLSDLERAGERLQGEHDLGRELGRLMKGGGLFSPSESLHFTRLMLEAPHAQLDEFIVPSLELRIAYLEHYGAIDDERIRIYQSLLDRQRERRGA